MDDEPTRFTPSEFALYKDNKAIKDARKNDVVSEDLDEETSSCESEEDAINLHDIVLDVTDNSDFHNGWSLENVLWQLAALPTKRAILPSCFFEELDTRVEQLVLREGVISNLHVGPHDDVYYCFAHSEIDTEALGAGMGHWAVFPRGNLLRARFQEIKSICAIPGKSLDYYRNGAYFKSHHNGKFFYVPCGYLWQGPLDRDSIPSIEPELRDQVDENILGEYWRKISNQVMIQINDAKDFPNVARRDFESIRSDEDPRDFRELPPGYFVPVPEDYPTTKVFKVGAGMWLETDNNKLCLGNRTRHIVQLEAVRESDPPVFYMPFCFYKEINTNEWFNMKRGYYIQGFGYNDDFDRNIANVRQQLQEKIRSLSFENIDVGTFVEESNLEAMVFQILQDNRDITRMSLEVLQKPGDMKYKRFAENAHYIPLSGSGPLHNRVGAILRKTGIITAIKLSYARQLRQEIKSDCASCFFTELGFTVAAIPLNSLESYLAASLLLTQDWLLQKCINFACLDLRNIPDALRRYALKDERTESIIDALVWLVNLNSLELKDWIIDAALSQNFTYPEKAVKGGTSLSRADEVRYGSFSNYDAMKLQLLKDALKRVRSLRTNS